MLTLIITLSLAAWLLAGIGRLLELVLDPIVGWCRQRLHG